MIKLLFVVEGLGNGGKERQLVEILKNFKNNPEIELGLITFSKNKHYSKEVKACVPFYIELRKNPNRFEPFFSIWKFLNEFKPTIIHTWDILSSMYIYMPAKFLKAKILDGSIRDSGTDYGWQKKMKICLLKQADCIIANSTAGLKAYGVSGTVLYNAIDKDRFKPSIASDEFNLIMVANFTDYKDHKTFLYAAISVVEANIVDNVYLLGEGKYRSEYETWINTKYKTIAEKFNFTGSVSNTEEYLSKCNVGVLCSTQKYSEGISNSVLEYMASGLIPIVTDIGGSREIIENEVSGYLIPPGDYKAIVDIIINIKQDPKNIDYIRKNAIQTIDTKFNYKRNIQQLESIYTKLIED